MRLPSFEARSGETVLCQACPNRQWYAVAWKIVSGLVGISLLTLAGFILFSDPATGLLAGFLPAEVATGLSQFLCLGLFPLLVTAWAAEDVARTFTGEFILTDQRLWVRGSPYAWSQSEIPLEDIASMVYRRDAVFVRQRSTRKLQVHMFAGAKAFVKAYEKLSSQK
jgi:hypothetical protein